MDENDGLLYAYLLNGQREGQPLDWAGVRGWSAGDGCVWVHLDRNDPQSQDWLRQDAGLDPLVCEALLAEETRPRSTPVGNGVITILRGVNLNPGAEPDDMVSIRIWSDEHRIVSLRHRPVQAVKDLVALVEEGKGPKGSGDLLASLASRLSDRMAPVLANLDEVIDGLEEQVVETQSYQLRTQLGAMRRQAITLRRYIGPQREAVSGLQSESLAWLGDHDRARLREVGDRITRNIEDLDALRERAAVVQEELASRLAEQMNNNMYLLSIVAAIFLPLGLLTGLLGINVGGIPGTESQWAFAIVCAALLVLAWIQVAAFRRFKLL
jgi:zinc transporter